MDTTSGLYLRFKKKINTASYVSVFTSILLSAPKPFLSIKLWMDILGNMPMVYHEYAASYIKYDFFLIAIEIR